MVKPIRKNTNKNPPILSHEFVIQNHADIISCIAMIFVVGLMVQATAPLASTFIALQHNVTEAGEIPLYSPGAKDWAAVFFYSLICIVIHAIIQEYALDKISKKLHLSKSKLAIFSTSGQLSIFYLISTFWGVDVILKERLIPDVNLLWSDYPSPMPFLFKLYMIVQLAYSLHELPELYFQRVKREEYFEKAVNSVASLVLVAIPYFLNFNRLLVSLLVFHQFSELFFHVSQLIETIDKDEKFTKATRLVSNILQILSRLGSVTLAVLTLWYGMALGEHKELDLQAGYYNTPTIRLIILGGILILQMYLTFNVISTQVALSRENKEKVVSNLPKLKTQKKEKPKKSKSLFCLKTRYFNQSVLAKKIIEESDLPEVDQNTNKTLRNKQKIK